MVCAKTTVLHESGLHMRPAQEFVSAVANYPCKVTIKVGDKSVNGKSILSVMAAGIKRGYPHRDLLRWSGGAAGSGGGLEVLAAG